MINKDISFFVIEDNEIDIELYRRTTQKLGVDKRFKFILDPVEALEIMKSSEGPFNHSPYVIILDINLPKISGIEFLSELRLQKGLEDIPVIILTSSANQKDVKSCYHNDVLGYFLKPLGMDEMAELFQAIINFVDKLEVP